MFNVSSSPHIKTKVTTQRIMICVLIALLPSAIYGIHNNTSLFGLQYGIRTLILLIYTMVVCVVAEFLFCKITKRENSVKDCSALVTGLILAMNLPCTMPYWQVLIGAVFAIVVVKMIFGGLGQNFMNPALGGRAFLAISFAASMTKFFPDDVSVVDATTSATPLTELKGMMTSGTWGATDPSTSLWDLFIGHHAGTIGETSILFLLIGAAFLVVMKIIDLRIPLTYIVVFSIVIMLLYGSTDPALCAREVMSGGLVFGAFFMATDYSTSPITKTGRYIFGALLGIITALFRVFGANAEGVSFAIILCNLLVPLIEKWTVPKAFGIRRPFRKEAK